MISYFSKTNFKFKPKKLVNDLIKLIITEHKKKVGDISIIFIDDEEILEINRNYLNHDYYTDVITFNYNKNNEISGDIFISIDTVYSNSLIYKSTFIEELLRVIIHGVLHLLDYNDNSEIEKDLIHSKENFYLKRIDINKIEYER